MKRIFKKVYDLFLFAELMLAGIVQMFAIWIAWIFVKLHLKVLAYPFGCLYVLAWMHAYSILDLKMGIGPDEVTREAIKFCKCEDGDGGSYIFNMLCETYKSI